MFIEFLYTLRLKGVAVGTQEWLLFLEAVDQGVIGSLSDVYQIGRSILCRSENEYDAFDEAFSSSFKGVSIPEELKEKFEQWLARSAQQNPNPLPPKDYESLEDLWNDFLQKLREQKEQHDGGNTWIGTGGTSAFGHSGKAPQGIRVGGSGGGRSAVQVALDRKWASYRSDKTLDIRDMNMALRTLRALRRDGRLELDLDGTIEATAQNAGDIEIIEQPERKNQVHLVLLMDAGGSMAPHAERVERLFSAAEKAKNFRSFKAYSFHNCVYQWLYTDIEQGERVSTSKVLDTLTRQHRLVFIGDASMAPYELFTPYGWPGENKLTGLEWLQKFKVRCPAAVWLNPDPPRWWDHQTVSAIGRLFPMYELTLEGLKTSIKKLRAPI